MRTLIQISVAEVEFATTTPELQQEMQSLEREFSIRSGIDWQYQYRWMLLEEENFMLAKIKHSKLLSALTVKKVTI